MSRRKFDDAGYPCNPHDVSDHLWFYVEKEGLSVCHRVTGQTSEITVVPWRMIKRALDDHEKAPARKQALTSGQGK